METFDARLKRFLFGPPVEVFLTILNSINQCTLKELQAATVGKLYNLSLLGAHSVMQTIAENIYGMKGIEATTFYLKNFVDGDTCDTIFSEIAEQLHTLRNVQTHSWSSRFNHAIGFDTNKDKGWWLDDDGLHINPVVFMKCFSCGFEPHGRMWTLWRAFDELTAIRRKYNYIGRWLGVDKGTAVFKAIRELAKSVDLIDVKNKEKTLQDMIMASQENISG